MTLFKKTLLSFVLIVFTSLYVLPAATVSASTFADDEQELTAAFAGVSGAGYEKPRDVRVLAAQLVKVLLGFTGIVFLAYTVYGGYLIMRAAGNQELVQKGIHVIRYGALGILIILGSYSILLFVDKIRLISTTPTNGGRIDTSQSREYNFCQNGNGDPLTCPR